MALIKGRALAAAATSAAAAAAAATSAAAPAVASPTSITRPRLYSGLDLDAREMKNSLRPNSSAGSLTTC